MNIQSHDIGAYSSTRVRGWVHAGPRNGSLAGAILVGIALLACGCGTAPKAATEPPTPTTSAGPSACRDPAGGTASGFTGFGSIGGSLSIGPTAGDSVSTMCSATGRIVVITDTLVTPAPADGAV